MSQRLAAVVQRLRAEGRGGLSIYLAAGHPAPGEDERYFDAVVAGGADWIELGIPFSDPAADGPVIEAATSHALDQGATVQHALGLAKRLRAAHPDVPLVAMTYSNIAHRMGWDAFAAALADAGIDGCILPDVPLEESEPVRNAIEGAGLAWVPLVTPTTSPERMARIAATATTSGFLYVVSNVGITGQDDPGPLVERTVARARGAGAQVPLVVGFGIASADDVRRVVAAGADAAIVGSHIVAKITAGASPDDIRAAVAALAEGTR